MIKVCTGFSPKGREIYGERFVASFRVYWPEDVVLDVFTEDARDGERSLWTCPGVAEFIDDHAGDPEKNGRPRPGQRECPPQWKPGAWAEGYNYRFDAVKFCRQLFIPETAAAGMDDGDILVWLDGDVETTAPVPVGFVDSLLGDADGAFLGRGAKHSEIGFWAVRIGDRTMEFLRELAEIYRSDAVFELAEWHSAYVWDQVRRRHAGLAWKDLTPGGSGHVWPGSPLGPFTRHDKGRRKPGGQLG
jgi:hypothetical protein